MRRTLHSGFIAVSDLIYIMVTLTLVLCAMYFLFIFRWWVPLPMFILSCVAGRTGCKLYKQRKRGVGNLLGQNGTDRAG